MEITEGVNETTQAFQMPFDFLPQKYKSRLRKLKRRHWLMVLAFSVIIAFAVGAMTDAQVGGRYRAVHGALALHAGFALNATELRSLLVENGTTAYWVGPKWKFQYVVDASNEGRVSIRYLPDGGRIEVGQENDLTVTSYIQKNAYAIVLEAGSTSPRTSFINSDGNSVYSDAVYPTLAYMGIRGKNLQIEIYDPHPGAALFLADESQKVFAIK